MATTVVAGTACTELLGLPDGSPAAAGASAEAVAVVLSEADSPGAVVASVNGGTQPELASERADASESEAGREASEVPDLLVMTKQLVATTPAIVNQ